MLTLVHHHALPKLATVHLLRLPVLRQVERVVFGVVAFGLRQRLAVSPRCLCPVGNKEPSILVDLLAEEVVRLLVGRCHPHGPCSDAHGGRSGSKQDIRPRPRRWT